MRSIICSSVRFSVWHRWAITVLVELGVDRTGTDGVDAHAVGRQLQGQRPRQADDAGLGHVVGGHQRGRVLAVDRGDVDDRARILAAP